MKTVRFHEFGEPGVLRLEDVPAATAGPGEVVVQVKAAFVAFGRDVSTRNGKHPIFPKLVTLPHILGGEFAGVIAEAGEGVSAEFVGKRVAVSAPTQCGACAACTAGAPWDCSRVAAIGIQRAGSYAEYCAVPAANAQELPDEVSFVQGALLAANGPLAYEELTIVNATEGETVVIPGASGSVGTLAVALARSMGLNVIALTRGRRASDVLSEIGADEVLDTADPDLAAKLLDISGGGVDVVVDNVASVDLWQRYWPAVARRGRIVFAGRASEDRTPLPLNIVELYNRRAWLTGLTIGDPRAVAAFWEAIRTAPVSMPGSLVRTFPLAAAADAHRAMESGTKLGHFVLTVD